MTWRRICKDPLMWRTIDMRNDGFLRDYDFNLEKMCRHAIDRSSGDLVDINVEHFGTDELLHYITTSSSGIRRLRLVCCYGITDKGLIEVVSKLPLLEHLEISFSFVSAQSLEVVGRSCPLLKSLKLNKYGYRYPYHECNDDALAIASTMHDLHHLQLCGNKLTNDGLQKILECCPNLESLDLRKCFNVNLGADLKRRCTKRIKRLWLPDDSTDDYEFDRANRRELYEENQCDPDYADFLLFGRSVFGRDW